MGFPDGASGEKKKKNLKIEFNVLFVLDVPKSKSKLAQKY